MDKIFRRIFLFFYKQTCYQIRLLKYKFKIKRFLRVFSANYIYKIWRKNYIVFGLFCDLYFYKDQNVSLHVVDVNNFAVDLVAGGVWQKPLAPIKMSFLVDSCIMSFSQVCICCIIFGSLVVHLACWTFEEAPSVTGTELSYKSERRVETLSFCLFPLGAGIGPGFVCNRSYDLFAWKHSNCLIYFLISRWKMSRRWSVISTILVFYILITIKAKSRQNLIQ